MISKLFTSPKSALLLDCHTASREFELNSIANGPVSDLVFSMVANLQRIQGAFEQEIERRNFGDQKVKGGGKHQEGKGNGKHRREEEENNINIVQQEKSELFAEANSSSFPRGGGGPVAPPASTTSLSHETPKGNTTNATTSSDRDFLIAHNHVAQGYLREHLNRVQGREHLNRPSFGDNRGVQGRYSKKREKNQPTDHFGGSWRRECESEGVGGRKK